MKIYIFSIFGSAVYSRATNECKKSKFESEKLGSKTQFTKNPFLTILSNLDMNFIFEYVNLMFLKDFETFISQKNSRQKKL